jgi:curved DNA-binding protein CbpA
MEKDIFKDQRLLMRFVRQVCLLPDTPALIQFVAGDEDYLLVCSRVVNAPAGGAPVLEPLIEIGRKHGLDFQVLKEKLTPVALALGLAVSSENESDYYEMLGVPLDADAADIKKAFRKRVHKVHPDTSCETTDSGQEFIHLKAAYQALSDPVLRQQYDETLQHVSLWKEKAEPVQGLSESISLNPLNGQNTIQKPPGRSKIFYQLGILFVLLILAVFIFDFLYRQNSIFDGGPNVRQEQFTEPKTVKKSMLKAEGSKLKADKDERSMLNAQSDPQIGLGHRLTQINTD